MASNSRRMRGVIRNPRHRCEAVSNVANTTLRQAGSIGDRGITFVRRFTPMTGAEMQTLRTCVARYAMDGGSSCSSHFIATTARSDVSSLDRRECSGTADVGLWNLPLTL